MSKAKSFDPKKPAHITHNPWPDGDTHLRAGRQVWLWRGNRIGAGRVLGYNPLRKIDTLPGSEGSSRYSPFYSLAVVDGSCACVLRVSSKFVEPLNSAGLQRIQKTALDDIQGMERRAAVTFYNVMADLKAVSTMVKDSKYLSKKRRQARQLTKKVAASLTNPLD